MFEKIKNFNINFDALNEKGTFSAGDLLTGKFSFELTKETKITSITMTLVGKASVHWSTGGGGSKRHKRSRRHFHAKLDLFNLKSVISQASHAAVGTAKLPPGRHVYPVTCQIPPGDFPSSFRGVHGEVVYTLTVGISRPWHMDKEFVTELNFADRIDTNQPELQAPLSGSNDMTVCFLWCASGPITMTASVEKKAFIPGETVKIFCDFSNASTRTATPKVTLQQKQLFYTLNMSNSRIFMKNIVSMTGNAIGAHTSDVHTVIELTIPPLTSVTISNCSIIHVEYLIEVNLCVKYSSNLTVLIPIILCDTPVNAQPPAYL